MNVSDLAAELARHGLILRGGFAFGVGEPAPLAADGRAARAVALVGHGGGSIWPHFSQWLAGCKQVPTDPLDRWSKEVLEAVASRFAARAVFPSDKPYMPFQSWAMRAEGLKSSPLGILMHPQFGLWHAYRGALLFDREIALEAPEASPHLCDLCDGKDCMKACPADAVSKAGLDIGRCRVHLASPAGAGCVNGGCAARAACPHDGYRYGAVQLAFHMAAYLNSIAAS